MQIPFNKAHITGDELELISDAFKRGHLSGDGPFTRECQKILEGIVDHGSKVLLTHSCTAALEMAALLLDLGPSDEVIMPSYTFVSTANAFVLRGATPVFVDVDESFQIDLDQVEAAIGPHTKAIVPVHYAGMSCDMERLQALAAARGIPVVEDAAQALFSYYKGRHLGSFGAMSAFSFHETKNVVSGEGGAIAVVDPGLFHEAEIMREKGTNRSRFFRGEVDKYTWVSLGSSFLPGELVGAMLLAQLRHGRPITERRLALWDRYHAAFEGLEKAGHVRRPRIPEHVTHNAHMYYLVCESLEARTELIRYLKERGIGAVFHYVPLHTSDYGMKVGRSPCDMRNTHLAAECLVRLPLWPDLDERQDAVIAAATEFFVGKAKERPPASRGRELGSAHA